MDAKDKNRQVLKEKNRAGEGLWGRRGGGGGDERKRTQAKTSHVLQHASPVNTSLSQGCNFNTAVIL